MYCKVYGQLILFLLAIFCSQLLKKNMQLLMESVETLQQDNYRLIGYEKAVAKQAQMRSNALAKRVSMWDLYYVVCTYTVHIHCIYVLYIHTERGESPTFPARWTPPPHIKRSHWSRAEPTPSEPSPSSGCPTGRGAGWVKVSTNYRGCREHLWKTISHWRTPTASLVLYYGIIYNYCLYNTCTNIRIDI